jgi:hypothetical protein
VQLRSLRTRIAFNLETNVTAPGAAQAPLEVKRHERASIVAKLANPSDIEARMLRHDETHGLGSHRLAPWFARELLLH